MSNALIKLRWVVLYLASRAGLLLPRRSIPPRFAYSVAVRAADRCYVLFRGPRGKLIANLERVVGEKTEAERVARSAFRQYAKYIIDLFQLPALGPPAIRARTDFHGWDALNAVIAEGRGTIVVTLHFGQQETGAAMLAGNGYKVSVIAKTLEFGPINDLIQGFRRQMGMNIIPAEKGRLGTFRRLARNEVLGMLMDMVDPGEGIMVDFLGRKAEMSSAPARIALRTGARVVPAVVVRDRADDRRFVPIINAGLRFEPTGDEEADVAALTQTIAASFEDFVRMFPDQWFAFRPVWRDEELRPSGVNWNDRLNYFLLELANVLFRDMPKPVSYAVAAIAGDIAFYLRKGMRADAEDNIRHVMGSRAAPAAVRSASRAVFRNVCLYYADLIRLPRTRPEKLLDREMTVEGLRGLKEVTADGRGVVVATAHFGNPEVAVQVGALLGLDVLVLSEPLNPPAFSDLVHRLRESHGMRYEEVGFKAIGHALAHLRRGGALAITCDRDIQGTGVLLPFFGEETRMPIGAAQLALRTGTALVPAYCLRIKSGYRIVFEEPILVPQTGMGKLDAIEATKAMITRMESWIASDPGQWMVLERIWTESRPTGRVRAKPTLSGTISPSEER